MQRQVGKVLVDVQLSFALITMATINQPLGWLMIHSLSIPMLTRKKGQFVSISKKALSKVLELGDGHAVCWLSLVQRKCWDGHFPKGLAHGGRRQSKKQKEVSELVNN